MVLVSYSFTFLEVLFPHKLALRIFTDKYSFIYLYLFEYCFDVSPLFLQKNSAYFSLEFHNYFSLTIYLYKI